MKQLFATLSAATLAAGLTAPVQSIASAPAKTHLTKAQLRAQLLKKSAPGDEYFGRMKMSYLGINNTLRDTAIRAGDYTTSEDIIHKVLDAEDSLNDWRAKYPEDPQLARTFFLMGKLYAKIWTVNGQGRAAYYYQMLETRFPKSYFGKVMHAQLAKGFTEHILADALPCPTPIPSATPTPAPLPRGAHPTPEPSATPTPTPSPTPTPLPTAPPNSNIHITIIPQPCFVVTPSPSPTPVPTPTPSAAVSAAPPASASPAGGATPAASPVPVPSGSLTPVPKPSPTHHR